MCQATEWAVLPNAGGWYDQDPRLISDWEVILHELSEKRKKDEKDSSKGSKRRR